jgi:hypothetical protein
MISLSHPGFLWALAGLGIPIAIHLVSRKEGNVIYMGSLRHLDVSVTRQFKTIRLNQLLLLILRILLISILVLILSGAFWRSASSLKKWMLFENGTENDQGIRSLRDSLEKLGYESRSLSKDFPPLKDTAATSADCYWSLSETLCALPLSDVIIFAWMKADKFQGKRISLPGNQHWIAVEPNPVDFLSEAQVWGNDSLCVRLGHSNSTETEFESLRLKSTSADPWFKMANYRDSVRITSPQPISIELVRDDDAGSDVRIMKAALVTLQHAFPRTIALSEGTAKNKFQKVDFVIWLSKKTQPPMDSSRLIFPGECENCASLLENENNHWILTRHLTQAIAISENLTLELAKILLASQDKRTTDAKHDQRVLSSSMEWSPAPSERIASVGSLSAIKNAESYLFLIFAIILVVERIVAFSRKQ